MAGLLPSAWASQAAPGISIDHKPVTCVTTGVFSRIDACFEPPSRVARARVYFRGDQGPHWYYVEMTPHPPCFSAVLPRVTGKLHSVDYYVEATSIDFDTARTEVHEAVVTPETAGCSTPSLKSASVQVGSVGGAVASGFALGAGVPVGALAGVLAGGAALAGAVAAGGGKNASGPATTAPHAPSTNAAPSSVPGGNVSPGVTTTTTTAPPGPTTTAPGPTLPTLPISTTLPTLPISTTIPTLPVSTTLPTLPISTTIPTLPVSTTLPVSLHSVARGTGEREARRRLPQGISWVSELRVPGAQGQVVANGGSLAFVGPGRSGARAWALPGENRIACELVRAAGQPGTWRFEFSPSDLDVGSLRILAGEAFLVGPGDVVFRLKGVAGERVVLAFRVRR